MVQGPCLTVAYTQQVVSIDSRAAEAGTSVDIADDVTARAVPEDRACEETACLGGLRFTAGTLLANSSCNLRALNKGTV